MKHNFGDTVYHTYYRRPTVICHIRKYPGFHSNNDESIGYATLIDMAEGADYGGFASNIWSTLIPARAVLIEEIDVRLSEGYDFRKEKRIEGN